MPSNKNNNLKSLLQRIVQAANDFFLFIAKLFGFGGEGPYPDPPSSAQPVREGLNGSSPNNQQGMQASGSPNMDTVVAALDPAGAENELTRRQRIVESQAIAASVDRGGLLNLQPLDDKIGRTPKKGGSDVRSYLFDKLKEKVKITHRNLAFNGTDAAARSLVKTQAFINLLMDDNGKTAKRLIEGDASLEVNTASGTPITLKSLLQYSFDGLDVDYLVYGTDNKDNRVRSVADRKQELVVTAKTIYPQLSKAFLTLAYAMGGDDLIKKCQTAPTSRYQGSLKALFDTLQGAVDQSSIDNIRKLCRVPGYSYDNMISQPPRALRVGFATGDSTANYDYNAFVEKIIDDYMLLDQWLGHMVFDKMHITCAMAGQQLIQFKGEGVQSTENKTVAEVIGAVCQRLDERRSDPSDQAAQDAAASMRVRLEQVFKHVRDIANPNLEYPSIPKASNTLNTPPSFRGN